ncbi:hypothetical protein DO72_3929 [Burkholderia pseudomallei]|nr:hypothetical protein DO73_4133 [Burkholderia pseudomallei]KGC52223.1 hypothetical protein DO65_4662 [Burkholderia pseudomallei]KGC70369.1 hypothetical protein DP56_5380 [Burkholderia pseudomallei]KGD13738.1 hypothetical protein DO70_3713 [Burkholderia pseudomallei]KGD15346.1 hypothetical protein DP42_2285 [Burkholderia pseudomallei]
MIALHDSTRAPRRKKFENLLSSGHRGFDQTTLWNSTTISLSSARARAACA